MDDTNKYFKAGLFAGQMAAQASKSMVGRKAGNLKRGSAINPQDPSTWPEATKTKYMNTFYKNAIYDTKNAGTDSEGPPVIMKPFGVTPHGDVWETQGGMMDTAIPYKVKNGIPVVQYPALD